jgi:AraC-like DNA-binding protein
MDSEIVKLSVHSQFSVAHAVRSAALGPHAHFEYAISYYFSGRSLCLVGAQVLEFRAGHIALLNPREAHEDLAGERDYLMILIKEAFLAELLQGIGCSPDEPPSFLVPKLENDEPIQRICEAIRAEGARSEFGRELILRSLITELAIHLFRRFLRSPGTNDEADPSRHIPRWQIRRALEYLQETYTQEFSLERVSAAAQLSKYHLERVFKKATGLRLHNYVVMLRVERAKEILARTSRPMADVALELGFSDQSHFSNVFKQSTGLSPRGYRLAVNGSAVSEASRREDPGEPGESGSPDRIRYSRLK